MINYIYAIIFILIGFIVLFGGMSLAAIFIIGPSNYFTQVRHLFKFKVDHAFYSKIVIATGTGYKISETYYYSVNIISDENVLIVRTIDPTFILFCELMTLDRPNDKWNSYQFSIETNLPCMIIQFLKLRAVRKINKSKLDSREVTSTDDLSNIINSDIIQLSRDRKLNNLLN